MREPKPIDGARALLFERLVDSRSNREELFPLRVLDRGELRGSVRRELARLLNTRCSVRMDELGEEERTVLDYGIPDFSSLSPHSTSDQQRLAKIICQTIEAFEPRLKNVRVMVEEFLNTEKAIWFSIEAELIVNSVTEAVSFPLLVHSKSGVAEVHERK